jgi:hypothetical protein
LASSIWPAGPLARGRSVAASAPHPGAQLSFSDAEGHRFQVLLTNQAGDPVALEARHRARAGVEDAIRAAKDTGLSNLPFRELAPNAVWLELVLIAQDLVSWAQSLLLEGDLARAEPKRLRVALGSAAYAPLSIREQAVDNSPAPVDRFAQCIDPETVQIRRSSARRKARMLGARWRSSPAAY